MNVHSLTTAFIGLSHEGPQTNQCEQCGSQGCTGIAYVQVEAIIIRNFLLASYSTFPL